MVSKKAFITYIFFSKDKCTRLGSKNFDHTHWFSYKSFVASFSRYKDKPITLQEIGNIQNQNNFNIHQLLQKKY